MFHLALFVADALLDLPLVSALFTVAPTMSLSSCLRRSFGRRSLFAHNTFASPSFARPLVLRPRTFVSQSRLAQQEDQPETVHYVPGENTTIPGETLTATPTEPETVTATSTEQESVPWYLQVEPPTPQQEHPFSERQRLPDLPESPPALLQPILEHVSVELGLDHLSLIDLRQLDPPPALGANLLMVIGTARSEKHLHVSADRLCRWLRTNHHLSPFADGLLGRNELKLKMRRKAKRTRLLSAVGAKETASGEVDDGIRTGWVCVNVGRVEGGALKEPEEAVDIVGFGSQSSGSRIVVQMMTEEKRGQIDLETLWRGILRRSVKAQTDRDQEVSEAEKRLSDGLLLEDSPAPPASAGPVRYRPQQSQFPSGQQARAYHSSARTLEQQGAHNSTNLQSKVPSDTSQSAIILNHMIDHLKSMGPTDARLALGQGSHDQKSTPFLRAFYSAVPRFPDVTVWHAHIALHCFAIRLNHPGYPSVCVVEDLVHMRAACLLPSEEAYLAVLEAVLSPRLADESSSEDQAFKDIITRALNIMDSMFECGYNPVSRSARQILYRAIAQTHTVLGESDPSSMTTKSSQEPPTMNELISALSSYSFQTAAKTYSWPDFWNMWRTFPCRMAFRSSDMYVTVFNKVVASNSQKDAINVLRHCVPEMIREQPSVKVEGQVAGAIMRCLQVVEPRAEDMARQGNRGEWALLYIRCARALGIV